MERAMQTSEPGQKRTLRWARRACATPALVGMTAWAAAGCGAGNTPPPPPICDQACMDGVALRALRLTMKFAFNIALQGNDAGPQDATTPCPMAGTARIFGSATSDAEQGATTVSLTYVLDGCAYDAPKNATPERNFQMTLSGAITETGTLAVQPSSTTALILVSPPADAGTSSAMTFAGTVYDPPVDYNETGCAIHVAQQGNDVAGTLCGRQAGFSF